MNVIMLGPPGAGKGTQAKKMFTDFKVPHISTGDILREAVRAGTALGKQAEPIMAAGKLVPDDLVIGMVQERLKQNDCKLGFILDGFPRTIPQAEALDSALEKIGKKIQSVISLNVPEDRLVERISGEAQLPEGRDRVSRVSEPSSAGGLL
jgi:adenylate kinase